MLISNYKRSSEFTAQVFIINTILRKIVSTFKQDEVVFFLLKKEEKKKSKSITFTVLANQLFTFCNGNREARSLFQA